MKFSVPEIAQYSPYNIPLNVITSFKGSNFLYIFLVANRMHLLVSLIYTAFMICTNEISFA